ncbi:MAG: hypothetical protein HYS62_01130 [Candidatus Aenigmarchaeota archaeon]|nr:hypothetical protein [Candidatus Aenigmarchaeota archaeon]
MVNIFQIAVERLVDVGFYNFLLPFILFTTLLYAVLTKTKVLGESPVIIGIISVSAGLLIFGLPVIVGVSIAQPLTAFLTQGAVFILVLVMAFLIGSFFYPNMMEKLGEIFKPPGPFTWLLWAVIAAAVGAGLFSIIGGSLKNVFSSLRVPSDLGALAGVLTVVFIIILIVAIAGGKEAK